MLEMLLFGVIYFICIGWLCNIVIGYIQMLWLMFVTHKDIEGCYGEARLKEYCKESTYKLITFERFITPYLGSFKVIEYIIMYYYVKRNLSSYRVFDSFDILIQVDIQLSKKEN